jgi:hypothetical protein
MKPMKVYVAWRDPCSDSAWRKQSQVRKRTPDKCESLGWLMKMTKKKLVIAHTVSGKKSDYTTLPMGCVECIRDIKTGKEWDLT